MNEPYEIPAVRRAVEVLELLSKTSENMRAKEIAEKTDIPRTSLYRVLKTLRQLQCVVYDQSSNTYQLGVKLWKLGRSYIDQSNLYEVAARHMRHLVATCKESVFLGVLHEDRVTYIRQMESAKSIMAVQKLGKHAPAYCTATGRAIIAFLSDERTEELLSGELEAFNSNTTTEPSKLKQELERVKDERVAVVDGEYNPELLCISSPVFDETFRPAASLTVAMLTGQAEDHRVSQIVEHVKETADNLSSDLGYLEEEAHAL